MPANIKRHGIISYAMKRNGLAQQVFNMTISEIIGKRTKRRRETRGEQNTRFSLSFP
jgi:hypothetical protein